MFRFALDQLHHAATQVHRRHQQPAELLLHREARQEVEQIGRVITDHGIASQQSEIRVEPEVVGL